MNRIAQSRGNLLALLLIGALLAWIIGSGVKQPHYQVPEVDVHQAKAMVDAGALVIDVRGAEQFAYRHVPGAVLVPLSVLRTAIPPAIAAAKARPVLVYCNEGLVHGPEGTHLLQQAGFTNVVNMKAGIEGWSAAGLPVIKG